MQLGNEQGIAMMFSLVALVILSTLTLSFLNLSSTAVETTETIIKRAQSQAEAELGRSGTWKSNWIRNSPGGRGLPPLGPPAQKTE